MTESSNSTNCEQEANKAHRIDPTDVRAVTKLVRAAWLELSKRQSRLMIHEWSATHRLNWSTKMTDSSDSTNCEQEANKAHRIDPTDERAVTKLVRAACSELIKKEVRLLFHEMIVTGKGMNWRKWNAHRNNRRYAHAFRLMIREALDAGEPANVGKWFPCVMAAEDEPIAEADDSRYYLRHDPPQTWTVDSRERWNSTMCCWRS